MSKETFDSIREKGLLLYHYVRGSHAYGLNIVTSDEDHGFIYLAPEDQLLGLGLDYQEQISSERNDDTGYELRRFFQLLLKSNPTVLEALFVPERCVLYEHPIMTEIKKHRDKFITKACFDPFLGYSYQQIMKCRGLNKRFLQEKIERKKLLDFAYTFRKQGSTKIEYWLEHRGLLQKYCGLVNVPNMDCMYAVFYDWGNHFLNEGVTVEDLCNAYYNSNEDLNTIDIVKRIKDGEKGLEEKLKKAQFNNMVNFIVDFYHLSDERTGLTDIMLRQWYEAQKPIGYKGIVNQKEDSNEVRLSSVAEGVLPICHMHYDKDKYSTHCREYKEQKEWEHKRNPERYKENKGKLFDRKNVAHAVRLLHMGIEIAKGEGFNVDRSNIDRDFILNIRLGNTKYEEIIEYIQGKRDEMKELMDKSTLQDNIDVDFVNNILLDIRKSYIHL